MQSIAIEFERLDIPSIVSEPTDISPAVLILYFIYIYIIYQYITSCYLSEYVCITRSQCRLKYKLKSKNEQLPSEHPLYYISDNEFVQKFRERELN